MNNYVVVSRLGTSHLLQVDEVKANYRSIVGFWKWWFWFLADPESYLFSLISGGRKPISKKRIGELPQKCSVRVM